MELKQLLSDNVDEFFNPAGEIEPSKRGLNVVADWILEFYPYREELWEDPAQIELIATAVRTGNLPDFAKMAGAIRGRARKYAEHLIAEHEGYLIQCHKQPEPERDYGRMIMDDCVAFTKTYIENL